MKKLVIVESFTKTSTIKKYLNDNNVIVTYSSGHIYNLPKDKIGFDTTTWVLEYIKTNPKIINSIRDLVIKSDIIYIATDPDLEGETIAYNIKHSITDLIKNKKCYRISFNEITETAVKNAINNPREIDLNIVNAQETRRIVDRMIGYKISPILWSKFDINYLSSGRVQNAAVIICINQRNKILNNEIEQKWNIECKFVFDKKDKKGCSVIASLLNNKNIYGLNNIENVKKILGNLKTNTKYSIKYELKKRAVFPPAPYTTTTLQQDCYNKYKWNAKTTMKYAQDLYERGLISYIRTDSTNISNDAKNIIINYIKNTYDNSSQNNSYAKYRSFKSKINNAQEAHEAIRITNPNIISCYASNSSNANDNKGSSSQSLSSNHDKLYDIVRKRTLASLMSDAIYTDIDITFTSSLNDNKEYVFVSTKSFMIFEGFKIIYEEKIEDYEGFLKMLDKECYSFEYKSTGFIDNIPSLYNEVQLIKQLEKEGIGRPSTYASIIDKLLAKKYIEIGKNPEKEYNIVCFLKKYKDDTIITENKIINLGGNSKDLLIPTELGINVIKYIYDVAPYLCDLKFTSKMEDDLDDIIHMKNNKKNILDDIYSKISQSLRDLPANAISTRDSKKNKSEYKDGFITTRYGHCYYNKSSDSYTNIDSYLKWKKKAFEDLNETDLVFVSSLPKDVNHLGKPFKLYLGRYGLYLKDDKNVNHKLEKKLWKIFA
jgi:DNA topoisomerase I